MYTRFDKSNIDQFRKDLENEFRAIGNEYGIKFQIGNMRYSAGEVRIPNLLVTIPEIKAEETDLKIRQLANLQGLKIKGVNPMDGRHYILTDYVRKRHTYPWSATVVETGKRLKLSPRHAELIFGTHGYED